MIEGEGIIFLDGSFISKSDIPNCPPNGEFKLALGADKYLKVRKQDGHEKYNGIINKGFFKQMNSDYRIQSVTKSESYVIHNTKTKAPLMNIHVISQVPITVDERVDIKIKQPYELSDEKQRLDPSVECKWIEQGKFEWKVKLGSGQKKKLHVEYDIEYPEGEKIEYIN